MTDWLDKNGATMKRCEPVLNVCDVNEIPEVKAFPWKCKAKLSWNIAVLDFFAKYVELNCKGNHFLGELFSEIS